MKDSLKIHNRLPMSRFYLLAAGFEYILSAI